MKTFKEVINETTPSLVVFIHAGQQNAVDIKYDIEEMRKKYGDRLNVLRVDSSYDQRVAREYNLSNFPTYVLIKDGQELMRESGKKTVGELSEMVERAF